MKKVLKNTKRIDQVKVYDRENDEYRGWRSCHYRWLDPERVKWNFFSRIFGSNDINDVPEVGLYKISDKENSTFGQNIEKISMDELPKHLVLVDNIVHKKHRVVIEYQGTVLRDDVFYFDNATEQESWIKYFTNKNQHIKVVIKESLI